MDDGTSNSIAETKDDPSVLSYGTQSLRSSSPTTTDVIRTEAARISSDIANTFNNLGATFLSTTTIPSSASSTQQHQLATKGQSKGFIDACWLVPDEPATATKTAKDPASFTNGSSSSSAVPAIKEKLQLDENSLPEDAVTSPMQRIRQQNKQNSSSDLDPIILASEGGGEEGSAVPSSPSRRSQGEVVESWKRKMKLAQKKREQEAKELQNGADNNETDNDTARSHEELSFIKQEDDTVFKEEDDNDSNVMGGACQPKRDKGSTVLDPIFSAAMTLEGGLPTSRQELIDLVTGKCRVMIGADEGSSTSSEETDEWSDSFMTPDRSRGGRRRDRRRKSRRGRSRDHARRGTNSVSPKRQSRNKRSNNKGGGKYSTREPNDDDDGDASAVHSEITMTPEHSHNKSNRRSSSSPTRRQHQRTPPETMNQDFDVNAPMITPENHTKQRGSARKSAPNFPTAATPKPANPKDKNFIKYFIQEISNKGYRMKWYKSSSYSSSSSLRQQQQQAPISVVLFLQHGHKSPITTNHSGPAMVWVDETEQDQFYGVNLFDIRTLDRASSHDANLIASKPTRSIVLKLAKGNEFVFEAPSEQETFRFVHGMKWVIARLAFNLVIGNMDVVGELVDVDDKKQGEATMARAMDDVTLQMVDKSILKIVQ